MTNYKARMRDAVRRDAPKQNSTERRDRVRPFIDRLPEKGPSIAMQKKALDAAADLSVYTNIAASLMRPQQAPARHYSIDDVQKLWGLPDTMGAPDDAKEQLRLAFDAFGGFNAVQNSLNAHTHELGQMPVTSFMGYGALQAIAQNGMIRACIQTVADDVTKKWIEVTGGEEEDKERVKRLTDLIKRYKLQKIFHDAVATVGYFGGAFIFIDTGVADDDLSLPLRIKKGSAELTKDTRLKFRIIDPCNVTPCYYNCDNPLAADYMRPRMWYVLGRRVHASRLLALYDNEPPTLLKPAYNFLGIPRAQILWDYVMHWNEARCYSNDLLKKISLLVVKTDTDAIFASADGLMMFDTKIAALQRYRDNNSIYVCDKEREDVTNIQTSLSGATDIVRQSLEMVAAINRTPAVKLLGISPSGFNATGESDITNYYDHIRSQQELYRDALSSCIDAIQLVHFGDIDRTVSFDFVELSADNDASKAMTASTKMQMLSTAVQTQVISAQEMRDAIRADKIFGLDFLSAEAPDEEPQDMDGLEGMLGGMAGGGDPNAKQDQSQDQQPQMQDADKYQLETSIIEALSNEEKAT